MTKWRKLDNSAKIFPIDSDNNFSAVYRMSVLLTEDINPKILKDAVNKTLESFTSFKVCLKRGFFWYYLEENTKEIIIDEEKNLLLTQDWQGDFNAIMTIYVIAVNNHDYNNL